MRLKNKNRLKKVFWAPWRLVSERQLVNPSLFLSRLKYFACIFATYRKKGGWRLRARGASWLKLFGPRLMTSSFAAGPACLSLFCCCFRLPSLFQSELGKRVDAFCRDSVLLARLAKRRFSSTLLSGMLNSQRPSQVEHIIHAQTQTTIGPSRLFVLPFSFISTQTRYQFNSQDNITDMAATCSI